MYRDWEGESKVSENFEEVMTCMVNFYGKGLLVGQVLTLEDVKLLERVIVGLVDYSGEKMFERSKLE